jgi:hypothetical protein
MARDSAAKHLPPCATGRPCDECLGFLREHVYFPDRPPTGVRELLDIQSYCLQILALQYPLAFTETQLCALMPFRIDEDYFKDLFRQGFGQDLPQILQEKKSKYSLSDKCHKTVKAVVAQEDHPLSRVLYDPTYFKDIRPMDEIKIPDRFWDEAGQCKREFLIEKSEPEHLIKVYGWPIKAVILYAESAEARKADVYYTTVLQNAKNVSRHYGDYYKVIISNVFDIELRDFSYVNKAALMTWADYRRFRGDYSSSPAPVHPPALRDWLAVLSSQGIASYTILELLRDRHGRKPE